MLFPQNRYLLNRLLITALATVALSGCDDATHPSNTTDVTAQGAYSIALSHDGSSATVGSIHHGGSLWTLNPAERIFDWNHRPDGYSNITSSAFAPNDDFVATTDTRTIVLWQRQSGEAVWFWNAPGDIEDIALSAGGELALLGMADYTATLFDIQNGGIRKRLTHEGIVYDVSMSADGLIAATASGDLTAGIWNLQSGKRLQVLSHKNQVRTAEISPSGKRVFTSSMGESGRVWDAASGKLLYELPGGRGHFSAARFSTDEKTLLTGNTSGQIQLWNLTDGTLKQTWRASARDKWISSNVQVEDVAFAADHWLAAGANGRIYHLR